MDALTEKYCAILVPMVVARLPKAKVYLFGSRAKGQNRPGSDVDLGIDNGACIDWRVMSKVLDDIDESNVPVTVDLIDMHNTSPELLKEIQLTGVLWNS